MRNVGFLSRAFWIGAAIVVFESPAVAQDNAQAAKGPRLATLDERGLMLQSPDGGVKFHLGGRLHVDFGTGDSSLVSGEFPEHVDFRRVWIEPKLTIYDDLILNLQYDFSSNTTRVNNLLASYKGFSPFTVTVGNFKEPFSLDVLTSNNDIMFMERSLAAAFASGPAGRNTGAAVGTHGDNWTLAAGIFGGNINHSVDGVGLEGTVRATYAPILNAHEVLHFGISGNYHSLSDNVGASFSTTPESFLFDTALVSTGAIDDAEAIGRLGLEFAWAHGPFRVQAEYIAAEVDRETNPNAFFQGGYLQGGWVINGDAAPYVLQADTATEVGIFKRVQPGKDQRLSHGGSGVFEAVARYSAIDLTSHDIRGGFQQDLTIGLNWYPEPNARFMANYIHAWADPSASSLGGDDGDADIFQLRMQIAF
ncbi:OprO/OprP family phosphate-selective porin [Rhizobiaceae bacterium n13]|uniref:OprO/OprP family phosphate-selective porin n=1 Tax=Ferirhizobium litorale TaxID=2927786 RepID=A0AAE3QHC1_9HYPH|nr:porin [Fererhizobium litorale]MDI7864886.1 OprO/OprP family phosphate-selective porin [Fererhizobium litorale]MDI7925006.1 OprO/OprP family phosphate-selective porin [Fererhizobium litorale]